MSRPVPYLEAGAFVHGRAAVGLEFLLARAANRGELRALPDAVREDTAAAIEAIGLAAHAWTRRAASLSGRTEVVPASNAASSDHDVLSTAQVAGMLKVTDRQARNLAAQGLGERVGGRYIFERSAVQAEAVRRGVS